MNECFTGSNEDGCLNMILTEVSAALCLLELTKKASKENTLLRIDVLTLEET